MKSQNKKLSNFYNELLKKHSYQGWWPIKGKYYPRDYTHPKNEEEQFEIALGAILTQNTSWKNVEKSLDNLYKNNLVDPKRIISLPNEKLSTYIKSSGYYNQKAKKLKAFAEFYLKNSSKIPSRENLLNIWGIGKETADSILLYAYKQPIFIIDAYTKRVLEKYFNIKEKDYNSLQELFHKNLPQDYRLFNEFHALIVAEGKLFPASIPLCLIAAHAADSAIANSLRRPAAQSAD